MLCKQILGALKSTEVIISVIILFVALILINGLTLILPADNKYYSDSSFLDNMLANANTMIFDIAVILVFNTFLLKIMERRRKIQEYFDEIDDFRGWHSEEASHRVRGIIFRLNKLGVTNINLSDCCLREVNLRGANLSGARCSQADLSKTDLTGANLNKTSLITSDLSGACLTLGNLSRADLTWAKLCNAYLFRVDLSGACFRKANLCRANLSWVNFSEADFSEADFSGSKIFEVTGISEAKGLDIAVFTDSTMDDKIREYLSKINPTVKPLEKLKKDNNENDKSA